MTVSITYNNRIAEKLKELSIFQETTAKLKKVAEQMDSQFVDSIWSSVPTLRVIVINIFERNFIFIMGNGPTSTEMFHLIRMHGDPH